MPAGPAVSAVGPWVADSARAACVECHSQFGFFTRRHHCRRCGEVFCGKCTKYVSKDIPGLESFSGTALRVCKCCFLRHLSFMVVARKAFGVKFELFGSRGDAQKYFDKCSRSRLLLQMSTGAVVSSHWESQPVRVRIEHKAQGARNFLLGGHQVTTSLVRNPVDHSRVSFTADSPVRMTAGAWCIVFLVEVDGQWHYTFSELRGQDRLNAQEQFLKACKANKAVSKAVVLNLRGLTVLSAYSAGTLMRTTTVVLQAQQFVRRLSCVVVVHVGGSCTVRAHPTLVDGLDSIDQVPSECSAMLFMPNFDVAARHRCDIPTFRTELENYAGANILRLLHNTSRVAVVSKRELVTITSDFATAVAAAEAERITHQQPFVAVVSLRHEVIGGFRVLRIAGAHPEDVARPVRELIPDALLLQATNSLKDALRFDEEHAASDARSPPMAATPRADQSPLDTAFLPSSAPADGPPAAHHDAIACNICMEDHDMAERRPVMCTSCGNTICHECWKQTPTCPMCRCERPERPIFNIALQQLLEAN